MIFPTSKSVCTSFFDFFSGYQPLSLFWGRYYLPPFYWENSLCDPLGSYILYGISLIQNFLFLPHKCLSMSSTMDPFVLLHSSDVWFPLSILLITLLTSLTYFVRFLSFTCEILSTFCVAAVFESNTLSPIFHLLSPFSSQLFKPNFDSRFII